ncbi:MAG: dacA [Rickettsiales bacterium]|nr:dacA [Rickettsiales bacterium]
MRKWLLALCMALALGNQAFAEGEKAEASKTESAEVVSAPAPAATKSNNLMFTTAKYAYVYDSTTGVALLSKSGDEAVPPSSMSKIMTLYILFDRLKKGDLKLDDTFLINETAWSKQGSKMFVKLNDLVKIEDLLRGIAIQSGNDACIAVAEGIAGSEDAFVRLMNQKAQELGLKNSHFVNATGWPDEGHVMSAHDLAILADHLINDFPDYYHYFAEKEFVFNGIHQHNRNLLLGRADLGVDGLKTGHTEIAGYGIVVSAKQGDDRIIVVLNGMTSEKERAMEAERLVRHVFRNFERAKLLKAGQVVDKAEVWFGQENEVSLTVDKDIVATLPVGWQKHTEFKVKYDGPLTAPLKKGDKVATLIVTPTEMDQIEIPLVAGNDVEKLSTVSHMIRAAGYYAGGGK